MLIFDVLTLTIAGLLVGNELAIAALIHPTLGRLPDTAHFMAATDWKSFRSRWDRLHRWRVLLLSIAFVLLAAAILQVPRT